MKKPMELLGIAVFLECVFVLGQFLFVHLTIDKATTLIEAGKPDKLYKLYILAIIFILIYSISFAYIIGYSYMFVVCVYPTVILAALSGLIKAFSLRTRNAISSFLHLGEKRKIISYTLLIRLVLPLACIAPLFTSGFVINQCDNLHRITGDVIYQAIQKYEQENGAKPNNLNILVPIYIQKIPNAICYKPVRWLGFNPQIYTILQSENDFTISTCGDGLKVLVVEDMYHSQPQVLNLDNGHWSYSIGDTLDNAVETRICRGGGSVRYHLNK